MGFRAELFLSTLKLEMKVENLFHVCLVALGPVLWGCVSFLSNCNQNWARGVD